jgi:hypothetical protein
VYNKIFTKILDSSVWLEPTPTRIVWITLLAAMDEEGFCSFAAVGNVAGRARVSVEEAKTALEILAAPDPESSDPDNEGRRIERVAGGWMVLNATKYRDIVSRANAQEKTKERVRRFREKNKLGGIPVTVGNGSDTVGYASVLQSEAYTETKKTSLKEEIETLYLAYPRHTAPEAARKAIEKALKKKPFAELLPIVQAYAIQTATKITEGKLEKDFIPHPSTWFNQGRYDDDDLKPAPQYEIVEVSPDEWWGKK